MTAMTRTMQRLSMTRIWLWSDPAQIEYPQRYSRISRQKWPSQDGDTSTIDGANTFIGFSSIGSTFDYL